MSINTADFLLPHPHPSPRIFPSHPTLPTFPLLTIPISPGNRPASRSVFPYHVIPVIPMEVVKPTNIKMRIFDDDSTGERYY